MKLTNKLGLPDSVVEAVRNDSYDMGDADISVTSLIKPPQIRQLEAKHWDEMTEDVSDRIWALMGQAGHAILERAEPSAIAEERLFMEVDGYTISGMMDRRRLTPTAKLEDYKFTASWSVMLDGGGFGPKREWTEQTNLYRMLCHRNGYEVNEVDIVAFIRNWEWGRAASSKSYPQKMVMTLPVDIWPMDVTEEFCSMKLKEHFEDETPRHCTDEERWMSPEEWALEKEGRKTAIAVRGLDTYDKAFAKAVEKNLVTDGELNTGIYIERRPREFKRCPRYCLPGKHGFCQQFKDEPN